MDELTFISKGLYGVVCDIIGPESIIDIRRIVMNMWRSIDSVRYMFDAFIEEKIYSGSRSEGMRFASSDHDIMFVRRGIRAVFSPFRGIADNIHTVLLAETDKTKPGFALLRLMHQTGADAQVLGSLVRCGSGYYLSSTLWVGKGITASHFASSSVHGPCLSGMIGDFEVDYAECIRSERLPAPAFNSFLRLYRSGNLPYHAFQTICVTGCHFVAIGSKRPVHEALEWRISFSVAEKIIIHSFNHAQFLCYGLLKIFLKEAIESKDELKGLLCSYFMKTAVFWMLLDSSIQWTPDNFLCCFMKCLQLLLDWIVNEYCPSFFIPENNMIADKYTRSQHTRLLAHLSSLYHEGYRCLFRCPTIGDKLDFILQHHCLSDMLLFYLTTASKSEVECSFIGEMWGGAVVTPRLMYSDSILTAFLIQHLDGHQYDHRYQNVFCKILKYTLLSNITVRTGLQGVSYSKRQNSWYYRQCRTTIATLQTCEVDAVRNLIYCAIYLYRFGRYNDVLRIVNKTKKRLQHSCIMYAVRPDAKKYESAGGETRPILDMTREVVVFMVPMYNDTCIPELLPELISATGPHINAIPPLVYSYFLSYLCFHSLGRFDHTTLVLQEVSSLLHYDDGHHIHETERAISWDILGICQEMSGDYQGAYHSYGFALQQKWSDIKTAVLLRLTSVLYSIFEQ